MEIATMHDMSNTRKEIAARLGFAAKEVFAADKRTTAGALRKALKAKGITSAADLEWHGISAKDPDSTPYWLYEDGSMEKIKASRPGAKDAFAMKVDMPELRAEFLGFDVDSNGNKIARFKKYSGETVRIQTNGNLPKSHRMTNQSLDAKAIEQEVLSSSYASKFALKPRSSRPGAKASFSRAEDVYRLLETTPGSYANYKKRDALVTEAMRLADITPAGKDVSLHELAEMVGQDLEADRSRMSRPGAKASFAWKNYIVELKSRRTGNKINFPNSAIDEKSAKNNAEALYGDAWEVLSVKIANSRPGTKTRMTRDQTEEQKAGLKIMSAADPAVGAKIATLIKEGKPQDQAVAIALDMKRRGEL